MHLSFDSLENAYEYIEINAYKYESVFVYDRNNAQDMEHYKEIEQEATKIFSTKCDISGQSHIMGGYNTT